MRWQQSLEEKLIPALQTAAVNVTKYVQSVGLDFLNGDVLVVTSTWPPNEVRAAVRAAVQETGRAVRPDVEHWPVHIRRPHSYPFTPHAVIAPRALIPTLRPEAMPVFDIPLVTLMELRSSEQRIREMGADFDYVVTFAAGGTSAVSRWSWLHWDSLPRMHPVDVPAALESFAQCYHLFPGLGWSKTDREADQFLEWLGQRPEPTRVFIFDTGTKGNGPRTAYNVLVERIERADDFRPSVIKIVGLVDGNDPDQQEGVHWIRRPNGRPVKIEIRYVYVDRVLSEDCQAIMGYGTNRKLGYLLPLRNNAVVRLLDEEGQVVHVLATTALASAFHGLMTNEPREAMPEIAQRLTPERERAMVETILGIAKNDENIRLHEAWAWGLIDDRVYRGERRGIERRYRLALERYPRDRWDFEKKEFVDAR